MTEKQVPPANVKRQLLDLYDETLHEYLGENPPEVIKKKLKTEIDRERVFILRKLLGMSERYLNATWEIDHCNGRKGESTIGDYLKQTQKKSIHEIFDNIDLTGAITEQIEEEIKKEYGLTMRKELIILAKEAAEHDAATIMEGMQGDTGILGLLNIEEDLKQLVTTK